MRSTRHDIFLIVLFAVILHLPVFTGWIKPVPSNFTWWAPWSTEADKEPDKGGYYDYLQEYLPWQKYLHDSVNEGHLPLWNRYQFCGTPFIANRLLSPFYPPTAIGLLVPYHLATYLMSLIHFLIGPIFMYLFLRRINLSGNSALIGAFVFCSSGMFVPFFPPWTAAIVWVPAVLFIIEGWLSGIRGWRDVPWLALIMGFWFMEGYPVFVVHSLYFVFFYILLVNPCGKRLSTVGKFITALFLGAALSAVQNLPTLFFFLESARFEPDTTSRMAIFPTLSDIKNHLLPSQAGAYIIGYNYIGLVPILLLPFSFLKPDRRLKYCWVWFALCLAIATPALFPFANIVLPFWNITPHPPIVPLVIAASIFAAYGADYCRAHTDISKRKLNYALLVAVLILVAMAVVGLSPGSANTILFYSLGCVAVVVLMAVPFAGKASQILRSRAFTAAVAVVMLLTAIPWWLNLRHNRPLDELLDTPIYTKHVIKLADHNLRVYRRDWQQYLPPNMGILWGLEDAGGYDSLVLKRYHDAAIRHYIKFYRGRETLAFATTAPLDPDTVADMGIGIIFSTPGVGGPAGPDWIPSSTIPKEVKIWVNKNTWRAGFIPSGKFMGAAVPLKYTVTGPNEIHIGIGGDKGAGDVIVRDTYASGWEARVDGKPAEIEIYREWQRKVPVPPGAKELVMKYDPVEFKAGIIISAVALFISLMWITGGYRRRKAVESTRDEE